MPYTIGWEPHGIHSRFSGDVTGKEIIAHSAKLHGDVRFDSVRFIIADFSGTQQLNITLDEVKEIAARDAVAALSNPRVRVAIVSNSETIDAGSAFYKADSASSAWKTDIFRTLEEARRWAEGG